MRVLLVSFDAEHDTPTALRALAAQRALDGRWRLASAPDAQARLDDLAGPFEPLIKGLRAASDVRPR